LETIKESIKGSNATDVKDEKLEESDDTAEKPAWSHLV
jgi:hypothetical protein